MRYETLKSEMNLCTGERKGSGDPCRGVLYTCKSCGHVGCKQSRDQMCSNQGFSGAERCYHCGAMAQIAPVVFGDYGQQRIIEEPA